MRGSLYKIRRYLLTTCIILWIGSFTLTHIPVDKLPTIHTSDKTLHATGYFILSSIFLLTLAAYRVGLLRRAILTLGIILLYASLDEITQTLANRHASLDDWIANAIGTVGAVIFGEFIAVLHRMTPAYKRTDNKSD